MSNDCRAEILKLMTSNKDRDWTSQELTETLFSCKKGDPTFNGHIEDVAMSMQKLSKKGTVLKQRVETGRGYYICSWRLP